MSIEKFIKQLQNDKFQSTVEFSKEPPVHTQVEIEKPREVAKKVENKKPEKTLKLNINKIKKDTPKQEEVVKKPQVKEKVEEKKVIEEPQKSIATQPEIVEEQDVDLLFLKSETSVDKKAAWMEYYEKALRSKKDNAVTDKLRRGRFRILDDGSFIILPDLDTYQKSSKTLLEENWF
jgi:hypothetical protein